jgi:hypothetical protein
VDAVWLEHVGQAPVATKAVGVSSVLGGTVIPKAVFVGSKYDVAVAVQPEGRFRGVNAVINAMRFKGAVRPVSVIKRYASPLEAAGAVAAEGDPESCSGGRTVGNPTPVAVPEKIIPPTALLR